MKKFVLFISIITITCSCVKEEYNEDISCNRLYSPQLYASIDSSIPLTGILQIFPCEENSSIYYGNYNKQGSRTPVNAFYFVSEGVTAPNSIPVNLPIGIYNMIYWGIPASQPNDPTYDPALARDPVLTISRDLSSEYFSLVPYPGQDSIYYPTYDFGYAVIPVDIGNEKLTAHLKRVSAGLRVILKNKNEEAFDDNISGIQILIGNISEKLNIYTAEAQNPTKTIGFSLFRSADSLQFSSSTAMVFPSSATPPIWILITLKNGAIKTYTKNLSTTLSAGTRLTLTLTLNEIFSVEESTGSFKIDNWVEKEETIDLS